MGELIIYGLKANLILAVVLSSYYIGLRKSQNYKFGRVFLLAGIGLSLVLPLIQYSQFNFIDTVLIKYELKEVIVTTSSQLESYSTDFAHWAISLYKIGPILFTLILLKDFLLLIRIFRTAELKDGISIVDNSYSAFSFFNFIFIGSAIPEEKRAILIRHEKVHALKLHSLDILICRLLEIAFWFNPAVFFFKRQLSEMHEFEADELCNDNKPGYLELMLQQNFSQYNLNLIHQFNSTHLKTRIMRLQNPSSKKISKPTVIASAIIVFSLTFLNQELFSQAKTYGNSTEKNIDNNTKWEPVDKLAEFPGGQEAFIKYLSENIKYPEVAKKEGREGTVYLQFAVDNKGNVKEQKVLKKIDADLEKAAMEVIAKMPRWSPAEKDGKKVAVELTVPIRFDLPKEKNG